MQKLRLKLEAANTFPCSSLVLHSVSTCPSVSRRGRVRWMCLSIVYHNMIDDMIDDMRSIT